jgi:hypothetical protein
MITSLTSSNSAQRSHRLAASYVQCACLLMLGSLAVFSKPAVAGTPSYPGPGASPPAQVAPPVKSVDPVGVPPGAGPNPPIVPTPPKITLSPAPIPAPLAAPTLAPPPKLGSAIATPTPTLSPASVSAPAAALDIAIAPGKTPTQGIGSSTPEVTPPGVPAQSNVVVATPSSSGAVASLSPTNASTQTDITEVLPSAQKLSESMRDVPAVQTQTSDKDAKVTVANNKCIPVSFRPDSQRQGLSLVDLTGDGLIISAVPNTHIQTVFTNAGYGQVDLSQAARWCITQTAVRALVRPGVDVGTQQAALLVQTGASMQLMSKDQWLSYQASMTPVVTAMEPVIPTVAEPEVRAKPNKPNKTNKPSKSSNRMVMETRKAAYL